MLLAMWCIAQPLHAALAPTKSTANSTAWSLSSCLDDTTGTIASARSAMDKAKRISITTDTGTSALTVLRKQLGDICAGSPISLLIECDSQDCQLSRANNFVYRAAYEETVVKALCQKIEEKKQVVYTSFGAGGMLSDFIILAKALSNAPDASITIHLIDTTYWAFTACLEALTQSTKIVDHELDIAPIVQNIAKQLSKENGTNIHERTVCSYFITAEIRALQLTTTLKRLFPKATLEFFVHNSSKNYALQLIAAPKEYPDILVTADINDTESLASYAPQQYFALCKFIKKHKEDMVGVYLAQSRFTIGHVYLLKGESQPPKVLDS